MNYLKAALSPRKQLAAELLVDNDMAASVDGERRTLDEISAEVGISRQSLHSWRNEPEFIAYMQSVSDSRLAQHRSKADAMLMKLISGTSNNGIGSVKALHLYYQIQGKLIQRSEVTTTDKTPQLSQAEITAGIDELAAKLKADAYEVIQVTEVEQ